MHELELPHRGALLGHYTLAFITKEGPILTGLADG